MALLVAAWTGCKEGEGRSEAARAKALFQTCAACHGPVGGGHRELGAPSIAGLDAWYVEAQLGKFRRGQRGSEPRDVAGAQMRGASLAIASEEDVRLLARHVAALPPEPASPVVVGNLERGRALFGRCAPCHGAGGAGNRGAEAPALNLASDWYLVGQLENFRKGIRGTHPDDVTGERMRTTALALPDEGALRDVVAYVTRAR